MYSSITAGVAGTGFIGPVHVEALRRLGVRVKVFSFSSLYFSLLPLHLLSLLLPFPFFVSFFLYFELFFIHLPFPFFLLFPMVSLFLPPF